MKKKSSKPKPAALVVRTNIKAGPGGGVEPTTNHNLTLRKTKASKPKSASLVVRTNIKAGEDPPPIGDGGSGGGGGDPTPNHNLTLRKTKKSSKPKTAALVVRTNIKAGPLSDPSRLVADPPSP